MIYDILEKRCVTDSKAKADSEKMTMVAFVADYFSHKYGVAKLAAQQQANFLSSLLTYKDKNDRVRHFLTLLGEDHEEIFCEEISETYMDMIKGIMLYKNYEGISERVRHCERILLPPSLSLLTLTNDPSIATQFARRFARHSSTTASATSS